MWDQPPWEPCPWRRVIQHVRRGFITPIEGAYKFVQEAPADALEVAFRELPDELSVAVELLTAELPTTDAGWAEFPVAFADGTPAQHQAARLPMRRQTEAVREFLRSGRA